MASSAQATVAAGRSPRRARPTSQPAQLDGAAEVPAEGLQHGQVGGGVELDELATGPAGVGHGLLQVAGGLLQLAVPQLRHPEEGQGQRPPVVGPGQPLPGRVPARGQQRARGRQGAGGVAGQAGSPQPGQGQSRPGAGAPVSASSSQVSASSSSPTASRLSAATAASSGLARIRSAGSRASSSARAAACPETSSDSQPSARRSIAWSRSPPARAERTASTGRPLAACQAAALRCRAGSSSGRS